MPNDNEEDAKLRAFFATLEKQLGAFDERFFAAYNDLKTERAKNGATTNDFQIKKIQGIETQLNAEALAFRAALDRIGQVREQLRADRRFEFERKQAEEQTAAGQRQETIATKVGTLTLVIAIATAVQAFAVVVPLFRDSSPKVAVTVVTEKPPENNTDLTWLGQQLSEAQLDAGNIEEPPEPVPQLAQIADAGKPLPSGPKDAGPKKH